MLRTLVIKDFVTVTSLEIDLQQGFTVLTGETGAGKSILFDALGLLLGDRADSGMVRSGSARADLTAEFLVAPELLSSLLPMLSEAGLEAVDGSLILRRVIEAEGRSRAWINGQLATLGQLKDIGEQLVGIHGQHAHQTLLRQPAQLALLDRQAGLTEQCETVRQAFAAWSSRRSNLERAEAEAETIRQAYEQALWRLSELESAQVQAGEWESLHEEHRRLAHGAELISTVQSCLDAIEDGETNLLGDVQRQAHRIAQLTDKDERLGPIAEILEAAAISLQEAGTELGRYLDRADLDPERLETVEQRLSLLHDLARRLRCQPEGLPELLESTRSQVAEAEAAQDLDQLRRQVQAAETAYREQATALSKGRQEAAQKLSDSVTQWLAELAMKGSSFSVSLEPRAEPAAHGLEDACFMLHHRGQRSGQPLAKIASGGELSRVSLAIAVVAAQATDLPTLLFDEVDAGIGGNTGHVVGRLLQTLGLSHQVMAVTHLPQVAARAHSHLQVSKDLSGDLPTSRVEQLAGEERAIEIARMLGDDGLKDRSLELARELLSLRTEAS